MNEELLKQAYDAKQRWLEAEGELAVWERNWPDATETRDALEQVAKDLYEAWREAEKRATK